MNTPDYIGHRKRIKEKFLSSGGKNFEDYEIIEMILYNTHARKDVKPLAKKLISKYKTISNLLSTNHTSLEKVEGINKSHIFVIKLINEVLSRYFSQKIKEKEIVNNWKALIEYCYFNFSSLDNEKFYIIFLNKKFQVIKDKLISTGNADSLCFSSKEILKDALIENAKFLILVHNHPLGSLEPSNADIKNTEKLSNLFKEFDVTIYEHLIIGRNFQFFSFRNNGLINLK